MWAIKSDRLFDGEQFLDRPTLLIEGAHIVAVGEPIPESVELLELPDLVDCHQHLVFNGEGTLENQVTGISDDDLRERARGAAALALAGGVTTLRDLGDRNYVTLERPRPRNVVLLGPADNSTWRALLVPRRRMPRGTEPHPSCTHSC